MRFIIGCRPGEVPPRSRGKSIAIIGAGPAGLTAAGYLACRGYTIHVYDKMPEPGGLLVFGVYDKRVPRSAVRRAVEELKRLGVEFHQGVQIGVDMELGTLIQEYNAVLIATGTWSTRRLGIPGSRLEGVYGALEYIVDYYMWRLGYRSEKPQLREPVVVIGGGLTAIDACNIVMDLGAKRVHLVYRRTRREAPAGEREFNELERRGVVIHELASPIEYIGEEGRVKAVKLVRMRLEGVDETGRAKPAPIPGTEHEIEAELVLEAVGLSPTPPKGVEELGIKLRSNNTIDVDNCYRTTREPVFAAGDVAHGPSRIGPAMKAGLEAAKCIESYLEGRIGWRS